LYSHADCTKPLAPMVAPVAPPFRESLRPHQGLEPARACRVQQRTLAALLGAER